MLKRFKERIMGYTFNVTDTLDPINQEYHDKVFGSENEFVEFEPSVFDYDDPNGIMLDPETITHPNK